jgi:hypothetical protein
MNAQKMSEQEKPDRIVLNRHMYLPPIFIPAERMNKRDASVLSGEDSFTLV